MADPARIEHMESVVAWVREWFDASCADDVESCECVVHDWISGELLRALDRLDGLCDDTLSPSPDQDDP